ncbi:hypothetical protein SeMB42_g02949 [Synchytrium endobioticum]|uniref:Leucine-rich repeat-containing N-terminal plant-type domain-containing protein n=1 Tax=Synchytrium endobioticum TaxID=286115 RepID=A0A507DCD9_9FUNG|nr:hypothetical protein SeLEV6574_g06785 [Synchytrium endobioticum]TPX48530.1 hypothetical protein SeMB42_g02949 [Synchytrium endobioticum]
MEAPAPTPTDTPSSSSAQGALDDCLGPLTSLYQLSNGPNWSDNTGWKAWQYQGDCCIASGVTCNRDGRVLFLNLTANNLVGQLPDNGLSSMTHLLSLVISHNPKLTGLIPDDLPNLPNLYRLDLSYNSLNGEVPNSFSNIVSPNLQHLDLDHNKLTGIMPPIGGPGAENNFLVDNSSCSFTGNPFNCIDPGNSFISCSFDKATPLCKIIASNPSLPGGGNNTNTSTNGTPRPLASTANDGLSTSSLIGIGIGSSLAFVVCIVAVGVLVTYRRKWMAATFNRSSNSDTDDHSFKQNRKRRLLFKSSSDLGIMDGSCRAGSSLDNGDASSGVMVVSPFLKRWWEQPLLIDAVQVKQREIVPGMTYKAAVDFRPKTPGVIPHPDDIRIRPNDLVVIESVSPDGEICTGWNITSKRKGRFPTGCLSSEIVTNITCHNNERTHPVIIAAPCGKEKSIPRSDDTESTMWNHQNDEVLPSLVGNDQARRSVGMQSSSRDGTGEDNDNNNGTGSIDLGACNSSP